MRWSEHNFSSSLLDLPKRRVVKDMKILHFLILALALLSLGACKKGTPEVSTLGPMSGFYLDASSGIADSKTAPTFSITGHCTSKFKDVEISLDKGVTWKSLSVFGSPYTMNCSNGSFSATMKMASSDFPTSIASVSSYDLLIRGSSDFGYSDQVSFLINFSGKNGAGAVVAGSSGGLLVSSNSSYKMSGRIRDVSQGNVLTSSGSNYQMVGGLLQK
jgi:hypothetical protein